LDPTSILDWLVEHKSILTWLRGGRSEARGSAVIGGSVTNSTIIGGSGGAQR
jgi:hypothetical protein